MKLLQLGRKTAARISFNVTDVCRPLFAALAGFWYWSDGFTALDAMAVVFDSPNSILSSDAFHFVTFSNPHDIDHTSTPHLDWNQ
jgi:hypothetical protein